MVINIFSYCISAISYCRWLLDNYGNKLCCLYPGFDMIRPAITNYFSNIAGDRQGFAGGLNSTFTSMGNFIGPLIAGALFDVHIEAPIYMAIGVH